MVECTFKLNDKPMSVFAIDAQSFPAFSGLGGSVNKPALACVKGSGPIPPGRYYIVERQSGGRLGFLHDLVNDHRDWFALYADDGKIDDETLCATVNRGNFRLHPRGPLGISEGCITLDKVEDFQYLRALLRGKPPADIPGSALKAYGAVTVT